MQVTNVRIGTGPKVYTMHPALVALLEHYRVIRDALSGEVAIKSRTTKYLPEPSDEPSAKYGSKRYKDYITRANFYNVTERTLNGLIGQVFIKDPVINLPQELKLMETDASVEGMTLTQAAKKSLGLTLAYSRSGLFVDFPYTEGAVTKQQKEEGYIKPTISIFQPEEVVNWRTIKRGAKEILSMVCIYETYNLSDDGFEIKTAEQYRVLRLDKEGYYFQQVWRQEDPTPDKNTSPYDSIRETKPFRGFYEDSYTDSSKWTTYETFYPTDHNGNRFREIPFMFVGSRNNDVNPDAPNFYSLASLNIAHYRNSADYEECVFLSGQPTVAVMGLDDTWYETVLQGKILMGSRGGIPLPKNSNVKLLQMAENVAALKAMEHKEKQMVALGAKLVEQRKTERTAFEVKLEATADGSVLSNTANNVSEAFRWALRWCSRFVGSKEQESEFQLNVEYDLVRMTSDEQQQLVSSWQEGALGYKELRRKLKEAGFAFEDDDAVLAEYDARKKEEIEMQRQQFAAEQATKQQGEVNDNNEDN